MNLLVIQVKLRIQLIGTVRQSQRIRQENLGLTLFLHHINQDTRLGNIRKVLRRDHDRSILLTHILQVLFQFRREDRIIQEQPTFIHHHDRRAFSLRNLLLNTVEQIIQGQRHGFRQVHQRLHLINLPTALTADILIIIKQLAKSAGHSQRNQGKTDLLILYQSTKTGNRTELLIKRLQRLQRLPDKILFLGTDLKRTGLLRLQVIQNPGLGPAHLVLDFARRFAPRLAGPQRHFHVRRH